MHWCYELQNFQNIAIHCNIFNVYGSYATHLIISHFISTFQNDNYSTYILLLKRGGTLTKQSKNGVKVKIGLINLEIHVSAVIARAFV